jgi:hypothetical protein
MSILYVSTVFHFHLNIEAENLEDTSPDSDISLGENDYSSKDNKLQIGNYLDPGVEANLDFVDIAGPGYYIGLDGDAESHGAGSTKKDATTNVIPVALWTTDQEARQSFEGDNETTSDDFAADISLTAEFQVLVYAVCYPDFSENTGSGIWHDPTFSVYMVFEATGFWALILLVAGIGLVGVATIFIKKRKDARI